jgi:hypothetical protein
VGTLTSWNPLGHYRPVTGLLYIFSKYILQFIYLYYYLTTKGDVSPENYKNFHKAAIMHWNRGISKPQSYRHQTKFWENTTHLHEIKI